MIVSIIQVYANNIVFTLKIRLFIWNCYKLLVISIFYTIFLIKYILNIDRGIKKISVNEIRDFFFEKYYKGNGFSKENSYYLIQQLKKTD